MKLISTIIELKENLSPLYVSNEVIGLVPTMGALHQGHLSLVDKSIEMCDHTIVTIFVNPTQFNNNSDLAKYPKTLDKDLELLSSKGCDIVFAPSNEEMYPSDQVYSHVNLGSMESILEGEHRPGHFQGVGIIVSKFFKIVQPTYAFFGQKDLQQYYIVKNLIRSEKLSVKLIQVPTIREASGLAMSSRNVRLSIDQRAKAGVIFESLNIAKEELLNGVTVDNVKKQIAAIFNEQEGMELEYFELVETKNFTKVTSLDSDELALCIAVNVGEVRLIDNLPIIS